MATGAMYETSPKSSTGAMLAATVRRATITIPDDLAKAVERYVRSQEAQPPLTAVVQSALRQYLSERGYLETERPLRITPSRRGSGRSEVSRMHDRYLARR